MDHAGSCPELSGPHSAAAPSGALPEVWEFLTITLKGYYKGSFKGLSKAKGLELPSLGVLK